ncbi:unnamed protein product [Mycena citricolor]|uniref:Zn(2)-C6 fungal-type domain-containing protein n=1 Tax=Mycena citricolor TaxID=2018698 RepID=A0AAD2HZT6_9AGAR|nr:unnamed protein product [Mycena citricolor]
MPVVTRKSGPTMSQSPSSTSASRDGDHRKRRRNRTTHSCTSCHTSKRMCDRKRPCTRCTQLGVGAECTYQLNAVGISDEAEDKSREAALLSRISDLERIVDELRRSSSEQDKSGLLTPARSSDCSTPPSLPLSLQSDGWLADLTSTSLLKSPGSDSSQSVDSLAPIFPQFHTGGNFAHRGIPLHRAPCDCLRETVCNRSVLELSLRLRRAADVLAASSLHMPGLLDGSLASPISALDDYAKWVAFAAAPRSTVLNTILSQHADGCTELLCLLLLPLRSSSRTSQRGHPLGPDDLMAWNPPRRACS